MGGALSDMATGARPAVEAAGRARAMESWARVGLWALLALSWAVMVAYMWDALTTIPDTARLDETRMAVIPTPRTFFAAVAFSGLELAIVLALLWPWRDAYYTVRLGGAGLALLTWFVITVPMGMSLMDRVHRRWLFFLTLATAAGLLVNLAYRLGRRLLTRRS